MKGIEILFLAIGAIIEPVLRYRITETPLAFGGLSVNILFVNMVGSFTLGAFSIIAPLQNLNTEYTLFISVGFCGSLTSMSSFARWATIFCNKPLLTSLLTCSYPSRL